MQLNPIMPPKHHMHMLTVIKTSLYGLLIWNVKFDAEVIEDDADVESP